MANTWTESKHALPERIAYTISFNNGFNINWSPKAFKGTANDAYSSMPKIKQIALLGHAGILSIPGSTYAYTTVF